MPTRSTRIRMDDQKKNHVDPKGLNKSDPPKQLQIHDLPIDHVENINSTNEGIDLLLANKPQIFSWGAERMPQRIRRHCSVTLHRSLHPLRDQDRAENLVMAWIDYKKLYDMFPLSWIINGLKMYKISDVVINFTKKTMKILRVELSAGGRSLAETKIQRGIFTITVTIHNCHDAT